MRNKVAITSNIRALLVAMGALENRAHNVEGMSLLRGRAGEGKTWGTVFVFNRVNGVFIRAQRIWSITSMLAALVRELGGQPTRYKQPMFDFIVQALAATGRPLFIDEADYLDTNMIDVIRDIYDCSRVPVILVGMDDIARGLANNQRFMRRITQEVKFNPLDLTDTKVVSDTVCEVPVAEDLLAKLHQESNGNIGLISNGLAKIEQHAKANGLAQASLESWGGRRLFFDNRSV